MSEVAKFLAEVQDNIAGLQRDDGLRELSKSWLRRVGEHKYTYNFTWMGRPIIQLPQDMMAMQELVFRIKPRAIVETGVAHGGSAIYYASLLELLGNDGRVVAVDIDIRAHNRAAIEAHPMSKRIDLVVGSSIDASTVALVKELVGDRGPVIVVLDSNHTHDHVLSELEAYSPLVKKGSYVVAMDTAIEDLPAGSFPNRPWDKGNNPKTAVYAFLERNKRFKVDSALESKISITVAPDGYLECIAD